MNNIINIEGRSIERIEYKNQPVITFKMIDELHQRSDGAARKAFNNHKEKFIEGEDYFEVPYEEWSGIPAVNNIHSSNQHNSLIFPTESGYLMIAKTFNDNLAWKVQRELVQRYFIVEKLINAVDTGALTRPAKITMTFLAREYKGALRLAKTFGLEGNQAVLSANRVIKNQYGPDCMMLMDLGKLTCEKQEIHLTATDLGKLLNNMSAQQTNKLLQSQGLIVSWRDIKSQSHWKPTEKGKPYTILKDVGKSHSDGTPVQQLMYLESILEALEPEKMTSN